MTTSVQDAKAAVDQAEADLASGKDGVSVDRLHKLRDKWRYSALSAQGARRKAEQAQAAARLEGLAEIGAQVDQLASPETAARIAAAVRDVADACRRARALVAEYDAGVAELVAAAKDLRAEPAAPAGPRESSAYVAVDRHSVTHKRIRVAPLAGRAEEALGLALSGDAERAVAEITTGIAVKEPRRPDHVLRSGSGGLFPMDDPLNDGILSQLRTGDLVELSDYDVDRYMRGELA